MPLLERGAVQQVLLKGRVRASCLCFAAVPGKCLQVFLAGVPMGAAVPNSQHQVPQILVNAIPKETRIVLARAAASTVATAGIPKVSTATVTVVAFVSALTRGLWGKAEVM